MNTKINKSDIIFLTVYFCISIIIQIYSYFTADITLIQTITYITADVITSLALIYVLISYLIPKFIFKEKYFQFILFALLIITFLGIVSYSSIFWARGYYLDQLPTVSDIILESISLMTESSGLPFGILLAKKYFEGQKEFSNIQQKQKESELKLLRSQLDPHFLFNNLNTLDALIDSNSDKAKEYISRLSLIYRYLIKTKDAEVMELSSEIDFAENYMFLIKTRFTNDYEFNILNNTTFKDKFIPTAAIQTLLENVVKHNKVLNNNTIKTTIVIENDWLTVTNSKSNYTLDIDSLGTGLENLKTRYSLISDKKIQIANTNSEYKIAIPIIKLSNEN